MLHYDSLFAGKETEIGKWFMKRYPNEVSLVSEITKRFNHILQDSAGMFEPYWEEDQIKEFKFGITKKDGILQLALDPAAMFFIGGMAKAITDIVISDLIPNILPETKKCLQCSTVNNKIAKYCLQCGTQFDS